MKNIKEYISYKNFDNIDNLIVSECNLYMSFGTPYFEYSENIEESLGIFNGSKEMSSFIMSKLKEKKQTEYVIDMNEISCNNKFFKKCYIHANFNETYDGKEELGYISSNGYDDYEEIKYDSDEKVFNFIEITVACDYSTIEKINDLILHELLHAYDDFIHIKNAGFEQSLKNRNIRNKYPLVNKILSTDSNVKTVLKQTMYLLDKSEQIAYIGQLNNSLSGKYDDIKEVIKDLQDNVVYVNYKALKQNYHILQTNEKIRKKFCEEFKNLYECPNKSDASIMKELDNKINKLWKKFINHMYLIAKEYITNNNVTTHDTKEKINVLENI